MAGPYTHTLKFSNGQVLNVYLAANAAVGTYAPCELNGAAASTSQIYFKFKESVVLVDNYGSDTAGQLEIVADDDPTGRFIITDASMSSTNSARVNVPRTFRAGVTYKLLQRVAGAA